MSEITNYPLCWPNNVPRVAPHSRGCPNFQISSVASAVQLVLAEINRLNNRRWDYKDASVVVSTNVRPTLAGLPASNQAEPADTGVAIYFTLRFAVNGRQFERPTVLTCDKWRKTADNIKAIAKDIEAQRARQRWGCTSIEQAFQGYRAIPEKCGGPSWWALLAIPSTATKEQIKDRFRELAKTAHPDKGGSPDQWNVLQQAYDQAMAA
jgi:hypothetical protein